MQIKVFSATPALITAGSMAMDLDPAIFGEIARIAVFSATGDAMAYANVSGHHVDAHFSSTSGGIGQLPGLPVMVVSVPILSGVAAGARTSVTLDPSGSAWQDSRASPYSIAVTRAEFSVGGTLSVANVTPGGGILPAGTVLQISGTGFASTTAVAIDGVSISGPQLVSPQQINVTLGAPTEMTGKQVYVRNGGGEQVDYYTSLPSAPSNSVAPYPGLHAVVPLTTLTNTIFQNYYPIVAYGSIYLGVVLLNQSATPITVAFEVVTYGPYNGDWAVASITIPPATLYFLDLKSLTGTAWGPSADLITIASAPIRMGSYSLNRGYSRIASFGMPTPYTGMPPPIQMQVSPTDVSWKWQKGSPPPSPALVSVSGIGDFAASVSGGSWLSVGPDRGTVPATLTLTPNVLALPAGGTPGTYTATLTVTPLLPPSLEGFNVQPTKINAALVISAQPAIMNGGAARLVTPSSTPAAAVQASPPSLAFTLPVGSQEESHVAVGLTYTSGSITEATTQTQSGENWLTTQILGGGSGRSFYVIVSAAGLASGTYQGVVTVTLTTQESVQVPVTLTILPPFVQTPLIVKPTSISLSAPAGTAETASFTVDSAGGPELFSISGPVLAATWLSLTEFHTNYQGSGYYAATPAGGTLTLIANQPGTYYGALVLTSPNGSMTVPITFNVTATASMPPILSSVVSAASQTPGAIAPGEIITLYGTGIGPAPTGYSPDASGRVGTNLNNNQVLVNGVAAPLLYASTGQVNAIFPYEVGANGIATIQVRSNGIASAIWGVPVAPSAPAIFTVSSTGVGQAAVLNSDNSVNAPSNPAARGTVIQIFAAGAGLTSPPSETGVINQVGGNKPLLPVKVRIGGIDAPYQFAGAAPQSVAGLLQVNAVVPQDTPLGPSVPITLAIGEAESPGGVSVAIQ